jgi:hypothetical protein
MNPTLFLHSILALVAAVAVSKAEQTEPLKALRAPDKTKWVTIFEPKVIAPAEENRAKETAQKNNSPRRLLQSIGEKDGGIYRVLNRYDDQSYEEFWITPNFQYLKMPGRDRLIRFLPTHNRSWNLEEADFPELYWAIGCTPKLQEIDGKKMLVVSMDAGKKPPTLRQRRLLEELNQALKANGEEGSNPVSEKAQGQLLLLLDPNSLLPVKFESEDGIHTYTFEDASGLKKNIPDEIKNEIVQWEKVMAELARPPGKPKIRNRQKN